MMLGHSQILNNFIYIFKKGLFISPFFCSNILMKNQLRQKAKEIRKTLDVENFSKRVNQHLLNSDIYRNAKNILCYHSIGSEVCTHSLFEDKTKNWFLPRINGDYLEVCFYSKDLICKNNFKVLEPNTKVIDDLSIIDLIIIPCVCADMNGYRLGYGKGYYDRLLKQFDKNVKKVILTYSDLLFDSVYPDNFDEKADIVITDKDVYII